MKVSTASDVDDSAGKVGFSTISLANEPGGYELIDKYGTTYLE